MNNWRITLHRKMLNRERYDDHNVFRLFMHLLLTVNYEEKKRRWETIKRWEIITSLRKLAEETWLSVKQIRVSLNKLKTTHEVATKGTSKRTKVSIVKYCDYQDQGKTNDTRNGKQTDKRGANEGQQLNNINNKNNNIYSDYQKNWQPVSFMSEDEAKEIVLGLYDKDNEHNIEYPKYFLTVMKCLTIAWYTIPKSYTPLSFYKKVKTKVIDVIWRDETTGRPAWKTAKLITEWWLDFRSGDIPKRYKYPTNLLSSLFNNREMKMKNK